MLIPRYHLLRGPFLVSLLTLAVAVAACGGTSDTPTGGRGTPTLDGSAADQAESIPIRVGNLVLSAELARSAEERTRGLSGRPSLPSDGGMLFVMDDVAQHAFWMKDMQFPLDFVWISADRRVADLTEDVPPPTAGANEQLVTFGPSVPVLYVLEVNAGVLREHGIEIGDKVEFELPE